MEVVRRWLVSKGYVDKLITWLEAKGVLAWLVQKGLIAPRTVKRRTKRAKVAVTGAAIPALKASDVEIGEANKQKDDKMVENALLEGGAESSDKVQPSQPTEVAKDTPQA